MCPSATVVFVLFRDAPRFIFPHQKRCPLNRPRRAQYLPDGTTVLAAYFSGTFNPHIKPCMVEVSAAEPSSTLLVAFPAARQHAFPIHISGCEKSDIHDHPIQRQIARWMIYALTNKLKLDLTRESIGNVEIRQIPANWNRSSLPSPPIDAAP